ncbi:hypothetical protein BDR06DRAFT_981939 [Suillus hirtellus]|nr:hypothetical protein BDR06DRAFT_981939 [Suillus hirtellus]
MSQELEGEDLDLEGSDMKMECGSESDSMHDDCSRLLGPIEGFEDFKEHAAMEEQSTAALQTAQFVGKGSYILHKVKEWSKSYIINHKNLPLAKYGGKWTKSQIHDKDLKEELLVHLQSLRKYISAMDIVNYLARSNVWQYFKLTKTVSLVTAQHWMGNCIFQWTTAQNAWYEIDLKTQKWSSVDTVVWFHDESMFYANDQHKKSTPQPKGEGSFLMVADFVSADYGWLQVKKGRDGYFSNNDTLHHAKKAMAILEKDYPDDDHIFVFDNATTHLQRVDDELSAHNMPKGCKVWGVSTPVRDIRGKQVCGPDGKILMYKVCIANGILNDGSQQELYWQDCHPNTGMFEGIARILEEHGFDVSMLKAQCENFNCPQGAFHCELSFIEQCWGYAKQLYHCYPLSAGDINLEYNVLKALNAVPLTSMSKFAIRSCHFMDVYHKGLNGKQAAWAMKCYHGPHVPPSAIMKELEDAQLN